MEYYIPQRLENCFILRYKILGEESTNRLNSPIRSIS